jgi:RNA-directed DNA polymerase
MPITSVKIHPPASLRSDGDRHCLGMGDRDQFGISDRLHRNPQVKKHAKEQWMVLYIERWLKAPVQEEGGRLVPREKGTPQGGVASPLLANLFLHYTLDRWLAANYPQVPFERYADDVIVHCRTEKEAQEMRKVLAERLQSCGLELHPEKTKIVYCKDDFRKRTYPNEKFDFLGYSVLQKHTEKEFAMN